MANRGIKDSNGVIVVNKYLAIFKGEKDGMVS